MIFSTILGHKQSIQQWVRFVRELSLKECEPQIRDKFIKATLKSRSMIVEFNTKSQFKVAT